MMRAASVAMRGGSAMMRGDERGLCRDERGLCHDERGLWLCHDGRDSVAIVMRRGSVVMIKLRLGPDVLDSFIFGHKLEPQMLIKNLQGHGSACPCVCLCFEKLDRVFYGLV